MNDFVFFYSSSHPFSNCYMMPFVHNGKQYNCSEQYMMWMKAMMFHDYDVGEMIMEQGHYYKQKFLGRQVRGFRTNSACKFQNNSKVRTGSVMY